MEMEPSLDTGPVVACERTPIGPSETAGELEPRLAQLGAETLVQALPAWLAGDLAATPQDESRATACSLVTKSDGCLRRDMSAIAAERAVRAYNPWPRCLNRLRRRAPASGAPKSSRAPASARRGTLFVHNRQPGLALAGAALALVRSSVLVASVSPANSSSTASAASCARGGPRMSSLLSLMPDEVDALVAELGLPAYRSGPAPAWRLP